ncbi:MAG: hydantoinase/oxoprolinase family protein [Actinomycetota bacterium]
MTLLLGLDTGGTFTDAVVVTEHDGAVIAKAKAPTTHHDLSIGLTGALTAVLGEPGVEPDAIDLVAMSTTLATNALVEGQGDPAGLVIVGYGAADEHRFAPPDDCPLRRVAGGHDALGAEVEPLDVAALDAVAADIGPQITAWAVVAQFAVRNPTHERQARHHLATSTGLPITCSHELSARLHGPRRALTAVLNARLLGLGARLQEAVGNTLIGLGVNAPLHVVRGDGSLAAADFVARRPIETILSGPAASVLGAQHLAGVTDGLVADIGGTTTDIAAVVDGRPQISDGARVAGHQTMVEAVTTVTHGIGGDSEVHVDPSTGQLTIGPSRAVPISRLALEHPPLADQLSLQLLASPRSGHGRFLVAGLPPLPTVVLDERERAVLTAIAEGPAAELDVAPNSRMRTAVDRLRRWGYVRAATFTPTDAALLLPGHGDDRIDSIAGNADVARLTAELLARARTNDGRTVAERLGTSPGVATTDPVMTIASAVRAELISRSADAAVDASLRADGLLDHGDTGMDGAVSPVVNTPVVAAARQAHTGRTTLRLALTDPIVAVGASAGVYYPAIADQVGTTAIIPGDAGVANAVGAAVGRVQVRRTVTVSRPRAGTYRLHVDDQPRFDTPEAARAAGEVWLTTELERLAAEAGAADIEIDLVWSARTATVEGRVVLVEGTLAGTASGAPARAPRVSPPSSRPSLSGGRATP